MWELIAGTGSIFSELGGITVAASCNIAEALAEWRNQEFEGLECAGDADFNRLRSLMRTDAAWLWATLVTFVGGLLVALVYRVLPWLERNLEPTLMVASYLLIGGIIFVEVVRDVLYSVQVPWATTVPGYLFLIMSWTACSYNVRLRTHLSFSEFRTKMPRTPQFMLLMLDAVLWWGICVIVLATATFVVANAGNNYGLVTGTDWFTWWFLISLPIAFVLLSGRVFQNVFEDIGKYRTGAKMIEPAVLGGQ